MVLPNLLLILADDLGHNDVGWSGANPRALTPNMDALVAGGMEMTQHYVFKYCAPSRGMLMTGRYPFHFGFFTNQDANDYGLPVNFTMLPETLRSKGGYRTHAVGKWHLGFRSPELTPTWRGFDTYLGYYHMEEDYYTHKFSGTGCQPNGTEVGAGGFTDFSNSSGSSIQTLWGHGGTPKPAHRPAQELEGSSHRVTPWSAGECTVGTNTCRHIFQHQISNSTTADATACCAKCAAEKTCLSWTWYHAAATQAGNWPKLCALMSTANKVNPGKTQCDSGTKGPPGEQPEEDYSALIFAKEASRLITRHAEVYTPQGIPMFMYLPWQSVHGPEESPSRFVDMYGDPTDKAHYIADVARRTHQGMVSALDEAIGNVTATLKETGLWDNLFIWFTSDNGGPLPGANNFPMRGGKFTDWEGGTRVRAFVHGSPQLLPLARVGTKFDGMMHACDVYRTFLELASITLPHNGDDATGGGTGPVAFDGYNQLEALRSGNASMSERHEVLMAPIVGASGDASALNPALCALNVKKDVRKWGQNCGGAMRVGDFKVIVGYPGDSRALPLPASELHASELIAEEDKLFGITPEVRRRLGGGGGNPGLDGCMYNNGTGCPCFFKPCLFDVEHDPSESKDLAEDPAHAATLRQLLARLKEISGTYMPPAGLIGALGTADSKLQCNAAQTSECFEPYGKFIPWPQPGLPPAYVRE